MFTLSRGWLGVFSLALALFAVPSLARQPQNATAAQPANEQVQPAAAAPVAPPPVAPAPVAPPPVAPVAAAPPTSAPTPTTNVGASANSNVQSVSLTLTSVTAAQLGAAVNVPQGTIQWDPSEYAEKLLAMNNLVRQVCANHAALIDDGSTYTLINVIRLNPPQTQQSVRTQTVASNNWYVLANKNKSWYQGWPGHWGLSDFDGATRLYGAREILIVSIILSNVTPTNPQLGYTFTVTKATPTNLASVMALLGVVLPAGTPVAAPLNPPVGVWGCSAVPIAYKDSTIKIDTKFNQDASANPFTASLTYNNETKQYWDVSFALPIKKASALRYDSTNNIVSASQINKQNLFAVADLYLPPANLSATSYSLIPHPFAGVAMSSQPLHSILVGGSVGLHLAEVYVGALWLKQQQLAGLSPGTAAGQAQVAGATSYHYKASFSVGIKISVSTAVKAIKNSK